MKIVASFLTEKEEKKNFFYYNKFSRNKLNLVKTTKVEQSEEANTEKKTFPSHLDILFKLKIFHVVF